MARAPLLQLSDIALTFGGDPVFAGLDLTIQSGDRLALVGRNGSGKSTLMRVLAGSVDPDRGVRTQAAGTATGYMEQDPDLSGHATLGDFAASNLPEQDAWRVEVACEGLRFDPATAVSVASGGERRRAALARLLAEAPDLMLLDEPTNHLDIAAILWLERHLAQTRAAYVLISHDRAFLRSATAGTLWLDRGRMRRSDRGFASFEDWRETVWAEEDRDRHKLDRKIAAEGRWAVEGISARRKRNQGRLRALHAMRDDRAGMIRRSGTAAMQLEAGAKSGRRVAELEEVTVTRGDRPILRDVSLRLMRGDRLAIVGPNGVGKTTLVNVLTGALAPDAGRVTLGTNLDVAVFDQARAALDPQMTLWDSLTGSPDLRVGGQADQVMVRGVPRHVVGYLKDFLFSEVQARAPVRSLSGGERARLLLARLMARQSNLLILDEPTNDLDVETLDLLQEIVADYDGTVVVVSHDRDFLDRVATATVALEGDGRAVVYAGGWSDYLAQRGGEVPWAAGPVDPRSDGAASRGGAPVPPADRPAVSAALTFTEAHRLKALPATLARLEAEIARLAELLSDPDLFTRQPVKFRKATEALEQRQIALAAAEEDWLALEEKAGG